MGGPGSAPRVIGRAAVVAGAMLLAAGCDAQHAAPGAAHAQGAAQASGGPTKRLALLAMRRDTPDASFNDAQGKPVKLDRFAGRTVVLNLWATWCAPCLREMPSLDTLARHAPEVAVVPVSMDAQGPATAVAYLKRAGLDGLEAYHDPEAQLMRRFGVHGLPATVLIDRQGRIAAVIQGEVDWASDSVRELLARV